jgi:hypothetical protein
MLLPKLSELDPEESTDGSTEALGLDAIADELASLLVPGIRERHQHPRFLTSIAISLYLSGFFPDQEYASDQVSEPWQVFEWHVVEGLVRISDDRRSLSGLPGASKVRQAIESHLTLNARRYLKSPANNGFHGVYRGLARDRCFRLGRPSNNSKASTQVTADQATSVASNCSMRSPMDSKLHPSLGSQLGRDGISITITSTRKRLEGKKRK